MSLSRREALGAMAATPAALIVGATAAAAGEKEPSSTSKAPVGAGKRNMLPLPFDPKKLTGLSDRLLTSHWENNYGGALKNLGKVEEELSRVTKDTPGFLVAGLKERELLFSNSVILHELYFGNLGGNGKADGPIGNALSEAFGTFGRFEELFHATARVSEAAAVGPSWASTCEPASYASPGPETTPRARSLPSLSWSWTCTSTPITWTTAPRPRSTSTRSSRTSSGTR